MLHKAALAATALAFCLVATIAAARPLLPPEIRFNADQLRVIDGDTLKITAGQYKGQRIRFRTVNAPEWDEPGGQEATDELRAWLRSQDVVTCYPVARDRWARIIADCD